MKKQNIFLVAIPVLMISACNNTSSHSENAADMHTMENMQDMHATMTDTTFHAIDTTKLTKGAVFYQCSMHKEVMSDKPGDCPKCGMKLVQKQKSN